MTFNLSDIGEGIHEVSVKEWFVNNFKIFMNFSIKLGILGLSKLDKL